MSNQESSNKSILRIKAHDGWKGALFDVHFWCAGEWWEITTVTLREDDVLEVRLPDGTDDNKPHYEITRAPLHEMVPVGPENYGLLMANNQEG